MSSTPLRRQNTVALFSESISMTTLNKFLAQYSLANLEVQKLRIRYYRVLVRFMAIYGVCAGLAVSAIHMILNNIEVPIEMIATASILFLISSVMFGVSIKISNELDLAELKSYNLWADLWDLSPISVEKNSNND